VFLPLAFVVGFFGQNFDNLPLLKEWTQQRRPDVGDDRDLRRRPDRTRRLVPPQALAVTRFSGGRQGPWRRKRDERSADDAIAAFALRFIQVVVGDLDERCHVDVLTLDARDADGDGDRKRVALVLERRVADDAADLLAERARTVRSVSGRTAANSSPP